VIFAVSSIDSGAAGMAMGVAGIFQLRGDDSAGARAGLALAPRRLSRPALHLSIPISAKPAGPPAGFLFAHPNRCIDQHH
jgi:hypothetical protein